MCGGEKPYIGPDHLEREHNRLKEHCMKLFNSTRKMGGSEFSQAYAERLESEILELYENFIKHNESKNIFAAARTPAVFFALMVVCYILAGLLGILGLETFANLVNMMMGVSLVMLITWAYIRYSGEHREIGVHIDQVAEGIWDLVSKVSRQLNVPFKKTETLEQKSQHTLQQSQDESSRLAACAGK